MIKRVTRGSSGVERRSPRLGLYGAPKGRSDAPPDSAGWRSMSDRPIDPRPDAVTNTIFLHA